MAEIPKIARGRLQSEQLGAEVEHPDADLLTAFAEQALPVRERENVLSHLACCAECREVVALAGAAIPETAPSSAVVTSPTRKAGWSLVPLRWTAAAATAAVVLSAVWLHRTEERQPAALTDMNPAIVQPQTQPSTDIRNAQNTNIGAQNEPQGAVQSLPKANSPLNAKAQAQSALTEPVQKNARIDSGLIPLEEKQKASTQAAGQLIADQKEAPQLPAYGRSIAELDQLKAGNSSKHAVGGPMQQSAGAMVDRRDIATANAANRLAIPAPAPPVTMTYSRKASADLAPATAVAEASPATQPASGAGAQQNSPAKDEQQPLFAAEQVQVESSAEQVQVVAPSETEALRPQLQKSMVTPASIINPWWRVTQSGQLQSSFDSGKTWNTVLGERFARFRTVAALHALVWAGGDDGEIWSSKDGGKRWVRAIANVDGHSPKGNIQKIEIANPTTVTIKTSAGETWTTNDGGMNWTVKYE